MIECTNEFIYKKKRNKKSRSKFLKILILITVISGVWAYNRFIVFDLIVSYISKSFESYSSYAVNTAIIENLDEKVNYNDIITVEKNSSGDIVYLESNSLVVNKISREIVAKTTQIMSDKIRNGLEIPALSFTGISVLCGYGKMVNYKSLTVSKITGDFRSEFKSSGINQTLHSIYVDVSCSIDVIYPLKNTTLTVVTPILVCESVLVGKVPEVYLNGKIFS